MGKMKEFDLAITQLAEGILQLKMIPGIESRLGKEISDLDKINSIIQKTFGSFEDENSAILDATNKIEDALKTISSAIALDIVPVDQAISPASIRATVNKLKIEAQKTTGTYDGDLFDDDGDLFDNDDIDDFDDDEDDFIDEYNI